MFHQCWADQGVAKPLVIVQTQIFNEEKTILQIQMKIDTQTITNTNRDTKIQIQWETFHQFGLPKVWRSGDGTYNALVVQW